MIFKFLQKIVTIIILICCLSKLEASQLTFHVGPSQTASGGGNPINIPPGLSEVELVWLTDTRKEISFSIFPGIFYGIRKVSKNNLYFSFGGGLVLDAHALGLGGYTAVGYDFFYFTPSWSLNFEYKQALGLGRYFVVNSYAIRFGTTLFF